MRGEAPSDGGPRVYPGLAGRRRRRIGRSQAAGFYSRHAADPPGGALPVCKR